MFFSERLVADWYRPRLTPLTAALLPLSVVFRAVVAVRRFLYRSGILSSVSMRAPVVVVGGISVGGTGKTPLARALAAALRGAGWHPGFVARGYGGSNVSPRAVSASDDPALVGDESLLLAADGFPTWVGRQRVAAARALLEAHGECDVIIADDGLQHYALGRDAEIAVIDAVRGFGNGRLLPAGPLREPRSRLDEVDAVVSLVTDDAPTPGESTMRYEPSAWRNLVRADAVADRNAWRKGPVHAIAGIGDPARFFALVRTLGLDPVCHAFPDHHRYTRDELEFPGATAVLMTEKDAVKCARFADDRFWCLPIRARIDPNLVAHVARKLRGSQAA
ncbi:MAG TPA: tetraacyldisaccharide 4'-kinase [Casimicrobiaceae bacterium]|nr:tetraacyldisaccharide 4'-kinase [Casimicrobiaceae bacterium]